MGVRLIALQLLYTFLNRSLMVGIFVAVVLVYICFAAMTGIVAYMMLDALIQMVSAFSMAIIGY